MNRKMIHPAINPISPLPEIEPIIKRKINPIIPVNKSINAEIV